MDRLGDKCNRRKFVRYSEGTKLYGMGRNTFARLAKEAGAIYKVGKLVLVNCDLFEKNLELYHEQ